MIFAIDKHYIIFKDILSLKIHLYLYDIYISLLYLLYISLFLQLLFSFIKKRFLCGVLWLLFPLPLHFLVPLHFPPLQICTFSVHLNTHRNLRSSTKIKYNFSLLIVLESLTHPLRPTVTRVYNLKWLRCLRQTDDKLQTCRADWAQGQSQHLEKLCLKIKRKRVSEGTARWYSACQGRCGRVATALGIFRVSEEHDSPTV